MNKDLLIKYDKDPNFKKEVDENLERYEALEQAAAYSDLSVIPPAILKHIESRNIYFYFGYQQPTSRKLLPKLAMYLAKNFHPAPGQSYTFVFFNQLCPDNYVLWNFREVFASLKLEHVAAIKDLIVVKPYFYHKAMDWMTYGTIAKFLKSKTKFIYNYEQLCKYLIASTDVLLDYVPRCIYQKQCPELYKRSLQLNPLMSKGDSEKNINHKQINEKMKMMKDIVIKKTGDQVNLIEDYELSQIGVPIIIKMLIFYLENNEQALQLEGIFRKSVSVDDLADTIAQLITKDYDYLLEVKNPHLIANLIKKFFSSLKIPIIPFNHFKCLISEKNPQIITKNLTQMIKELPDVNKTTLMFLIGFFRQKIIPKEEINKMGVQNLSICFAPCWFRSESASSLDQLMYASKAVMLAKCLIDDFDKIFGSQEEREGLYRKSYMDSKRNFEDEIDLGLDATLKEVEESNPGFLFSRCSSRYSSRISNNLTEQILVFTSPQFQESKISTISQKNQQNEDESLLKIIQQSPQQSSNPRFSRQVEQQEENNFLSMLDEKKEENPRFSRNIEQDLEKVEETHHKHLSLIDDEDDCEEGK